MMQAQRIASSSMAGTTGRGCVVSRHRLFTERPIANHRSSPRLPPRSLMLDISSVETAMAQDAPPSASDAVPTPAEMAASAEVEYALRRVEERKQRRQREQFSYQMSAVVSSLGMASLAIVATYLRFSWHGAGRDDVEFPIAEFAATIALVAGGVIGMEMWARFAHKALWHDFEPGWKLHKSHHMPRVGPFEDNDVFAIMNAVPAMSLCAYGFLTPNMLGGVCFGTGLGITVFGIMYMFIHDGLVHKRFPVGPVANVPYLQRVALAHTMHHADKWGGAPWGMFLGPQELESVPGAMEELDRLVAEHEAKKLALQQQQLL